MPVSKVNRLIRDFRFPFKLDGTVPVFTTPPLVGASTPVIQTMPARALGGFDLPVGFAWDILSADIFLVARMIDVDAGSAPSPPDSLVARLFAGQLPVGEIELRNTGAIIASGIGIGVVSYLWRGILNLPQPIQLVTTDQPLQMEVSGVATTGVPAGHHFDLEIFLPDSGAVLYGLSERVN